LNILNEVKDLSRLSPTPSMSPNLAPGPIRELEYGKGRSGSVSRGNEEMTHTNVRVLSSSPVKVGHWTCVPSTIDNVDDVTIGIPHDLINESR
jgi:hypothetical protein